MTLYEIDQAIMGLVDQETGEIADFESLDRLQMAREQKIENVACYYKNLVSDVAALKAEEQAFSQRRKAAEKKADHLKEYLVYALGGEKFQTARCSITFRATTKVQIDDPGAAIDWAKRSGHIECIKCPPPELSKPELSKLLKTGQQIPGVGIVEGLSVGVK